MALFLSVLEDKKGICALWAIFSCVSLHISFGVIFWTALSPCRIFSTRFGSGKSLFQFLIDDDERGREDLLRSGLYMSEILYVLLIIIWSMTFVWNLLTS